MLNLADKFASALSYESFIKSGKKGDQFQKNSREAVLDEKARSVLASYPRKLNFLIIAESWCGDVIASVPVINKLVGELSNLDLKIISRDENPDLMDAYLTNGKKAVPKLIITDENYQELGVWGPRPQTAQEFYHKHANLLKLGLIGKGLIFEKVKKFYRENRGKEVQKEIAEIIAGISPKP